MLHNLQHLILLRECGCETFDIFFSWVHFYVCICALQMYVCSLSEKRCTSPSDQFVSLKKKLFNFLKYFDINFLVIEFEGCMNEKLQVWCKCTAPYIWLWRAREWGSSSAVSQSFRPYHWFLPIISGPWDLRPPMISVVCDILSPVVLSSPYHMTYLTNQTISCSTTYKNTRFDWF